MSFHTVHFGLWRSPGSYSNDNPQMVTISETDLDFFFVTNLIPLITDTF